MTLKTLWTEIRSGLWDGGLTGAKYGALVGVIVAFIVWIIFRPFSGFFLGSLLGLWYGMLTGAFIGAGMGAVLSLNLAYAASPTERQSPKNPAMALSLVLGLLGGSLFGDGLWFLLAGPFIGLLIALILTRQSKKRPQTFAERVMSDPDLIFGLGVWGIFGTLVGGIVGYSIGHSLGLLDGALLGALLGLAIGHSKAHHPADIHEGPSTQRP